MVPRVKGCTVRPTRHQVEERRVLAAGEHLHAEEAALAVNEVRAPRECIAHGALSSMEHPESRDGDNHAFVTIRGVCKPTATGLARTASHTRVDGRDEAVARTDRRRRWNCIDHAVLASKMETAGRLASPLRVDDLWRREPSRLKERRPDSCFGPPG
jgi:hypothetical protein